MSSFAFGVTSGRKDKHQISSERTCFQAPSNTTASAEAPPAVVVYHSMIAKLERAAVLCTEYMYVVHDLSFQT